MRASAAAFLAGLFALAGALTAREAKAFCRTTTCRLPADFSPSNGECYPPDFSAQCAALSPPVTIRPLYWADACISYDIQKDASVHIPYGVAAPIIRAAFDKWTSATCVATAGMPRAGITVIDHGPADCGKVEYSTSQGDDHIIVFRDSLDAVMASHFNGTNTLGLTTVTFNPETGEIYDADTEINTTLGLSVGDPVSGYDFESIITHETGHFLGLAHSADTSATMYAQYTPDSTSMRTLTADDVSGLCSIYPGGSTRNVDVSVAPSGQVSAPVKTCDGTPRHGFSSSCVQPEQHKGCTIAAVDPSDGSGSVGLFALVVASTGIAGVRKRARAAARKS